MTILDPSKATHADLFVPGSSGWSVEDLNDPAIEKIWEREHYEIIEGVITTMPPAYFDGGFALHKLIRLFQSHVEAGGEAWGVGCEIDLILSPRRVVKPDAVILSPQDLAKQRRENTKRGKKKLVYGRILVAPTLIIESVSMDHESHDEKTKLHWYAEARVANYWLLNAYTRSLKCLALRGDEYEVEAEGKGNASVKPLAFPGLVIPLKQLWA